MVAKANGVLGVSPAGVGLHFTSHLIALVALFIACFAIAGYITYRDDSIPGSALKDHDQDFDDVEATTLSLSGNATIGGVLTAPNTSGVGDSLKDTGRYYLYEYFTQKPCLNATLAANTPNATEIAASFAANKNFEILGTNASDDDVTFSATVGGIQMQTDGGDNDQIIVLPHLDTNQTAWANVNWGTENQTEWECSIRTDSTITNMAFWAGLKLTNTAVYATDADQIYFLYATDDDMGALTTNANLHAVYSVGGTDYITNLGIAVAANTNYHLKITIDSSRRASVFVNGTQYSLTSATTAGGVLTGTGATKSLALTNDIDLIPYVGLQSLSAAANTLTLSYEAISRVIFE